VIGRNEDKPETRKVADVHAVEALMLNPDGKLILLEGARDAIDDTRTKRCEAVRDRLNEVRGFGTGGKATGSPFSN